MCCINLTNEQKTLILTSRLSFSDDNVSQIKNLILDTKFNWFEFSKLALYHKTLTLCWRNITNIAPNVFIPKYLKDIIKFSYNSIKTSNEYYQEEISYVIKYLRENDICIMPVKGAMLIPELYKDFGIRYSGDADFLVKFNDVKKLDILLNQINYIKGKYDSEKKSIIPISRAEDIKWKVSMSNLHPYSKIHDNELYRYYKLDFRHSLDDSLNKEPINEIIDEYQRINKINPAHILIHLCTHFYDEAKHSLTIYSAKDFNLIKLCDIREYISLFNNKGDVFKATIDFANKYGLQKQLYYSMFCLNLIYNDGYEKEIMSQINIADTQFLNTFGDNTKNENQKFKKVFWDRFFSCGNADELSCQPSFFNI